MQYLLAKCRKTNIYAQPTNAITYDKQSYNYTHICLVSAIKKLYIEVFNTQRHKTLKKSNNLLLSFYLSI